jgi:hypothetical protein
MNLTAHFTLEELYASEIADRLGIDNMPDDPEVLNNIKFLADNLEKVRSILGKPIYINSAYRCPLVNATLGSKSTSAHIKGLAADLVCPTFGSPSDIIIRIMGSDIVYDQLILEFDRWVHIAFSKENPRKQNLIIDKSGTRTFKG